MTSSEKALADQRKLEIQREINSHPVIIDRSCHTKLNGARILLKVSKANYKLTVPVGYRPKTIAKV